MDIGDGSVPVAAPLALVSKVKAKASSHSTLPPHSSSCSPLSLLSGSPRRSWWMTSVYEAAATTIINQAQVTLICRLASCLQSRPHCRSKKPCARGLTLSLWWNLKGAYRWTAVSLAVIEISYVLFAAQLKCFNYPILSPVYLASLKISEKLFCSGTQKDLWKR